MSISQICCLSEDFPPICNPNNYACVRNGPALRTTKNNLITALYEFSQPGAYHWRFRLDSSVSTEAGNASLVGTLFNSSGSCVADWTVYDTTPCGTPLESGTTFHFDGPVAKVYLAYSPAPFAFTDSGYPDIYKVAPSFTYSVYVTNSSHTDELYAQYTTPIEITWTNNYPATDFEPRMAGWLNWPNDYVLPPMSDCKSGTVCDRPFNLGIPPPSNPIPNSVPIWIFVGDVDSEAVSFRASYVGTNCSVGIIVPVNASFSLFDELSLKINYWSHVLDFIPSTGYYGSCTVAYTLTDEFGATSTSQISFNMDPLPPQSTNYTFYVANATSLVTFDARTWGTNNGMTRLEILSFSDPRGTKLYIGGTEITSPNQWIYHNNFNVTSDSFGTNFTYELEWINSGDQYSTPMDPPLQLVFNYMDQPGLVSSTYEINLAYRKPNEHPTLQSVDLRNPSNPIEGPIASSGLTNSTDFEISSSLSVYRIPMFYRTDDVDSYNGIVTGEVSILGLGPTFAKPTFDFAQNLVIERSVGGANAVILNGTIQAVNEAVSTMWINIQYLQQTQFEVRMAIHDNGNYGACAVGDARLCDKMATAVHYVNVSTRNVVSTGCTPPQPGPHFVCDESTWISFGDVTEPTITVTGPTIVVGDLHVSGDLTFTGLGMVKTVNGCISINGSIILELSPEQIEKLYPAGKVTKGGGKPVTLLEQSSSCSNSLNGLQLTVKDTKKCKKVKVSTDDSTKTSLVGLFTLDKTKCQTPWIILGSVLGVVAIAGVATTLIILYNKRKFSTKP
jgi:hypothetical protein